MFAPRNRLLAVTAALLCAAFAPCPADASIPDAIAHPQLIQAAAPSAPSYVLLSVAADGSCRVEFCRNDPVNVTDPTGLKWLVQDRHLYWTGYEYQGSALREVITEDYGELIDGFELTPAQLKVVQSKFAAMMQTHGGSTPFLFLDDEDVYDSLLLMFGFFPERVNMAWGRVDPAQVRSCIEAARTRADSQSTVVGPGLVPGDVSAILAYSDAAYANGAFNRRHPIVMRIGVEAVEIMPYALLGARVMGAPQPAAQVSRGNIASKKPLLPDEAWTKNAPKQVAPGTKPIEHPKYNPKTGELEKSVVEYDQYGRQIKRTDMSDHGYPKDHTVPHTHKYEYSQGFPYGHEVGR